MKRQPVSFEWHVAEDEAAWEEIRLAPARLSEVQAQTENTENVAHSGDRRFGISFLVSQIPGEFSTTTFLAHQIVSRLLTGTINGSATREAMGMRSEDSFAFRWRAMRRGLRSWLQTDLLAEPWSSDRQAAELFRRTYRAHFPLTLDHVTWGTELPLTDEERMMWQNAAAESVVAYLVATYGRERLPDLLRGFHLYRDWNMLVTGALGLSVAEFEDGWNRYLQQQT